MKRVGLMAIVMLTAAAFVMGAVACSDDNKDDNSSPTSTTEANMTTEPTSADVTPGGSTTPNGTPQASGPIDVTLSSMNGSSVTGTATLTANADGTSTSVTVDITGGLTEGEHQNHIHGPGTCESPADVQDALTPLQADASGAATGETPAVPEPLSAFTGGQNYVAVHAADGTVVACGNIPAM